VPEAVPPSLFDHVTLRVRDLSLSRAFYEQLPTATTSRPSSTPHP
jgi:hypothetical protein